MTDKIKILIDNSHRRNFAVAEKDSCEQMQTTDLTFEPILSDLNFLRNVIYEIKRERWKSKTLVLDPLDYLKLVQTLFYFQSEIFPPQIPKSVSYLGYEIFCGLNFSAAMAILEDKHQIAQAIFVAQKEAKEKEEVK